jgi:hypothetical protein
MLEPKTHFEQVPLEIVKEIIEKQIKPEIATEPGHATEKKTSHKVLSANAQQWGGQR